MTDMIEIVARAICKSRTCEGQSCCQWPANTGRTKCPVKQGGYDDAAREAIKAIQEPTATALWRAVEEAHSMLADGAPYGHIAALLAGTMQKHRPAAGGQEKGVA